MKLFVTESVAAHRDLDAHDRESERESCLTWMCLLMTGNVVALRDVAVRDRECNSSEGCGSL